MLSASPVDFASIEQTVNALFYEWLTGYFDGAAHDVGGRSAVLFPTATVHFQEADPPRPQLHPAIHWLWPAAGRQKTAWEPTSNGPDRVTAIRQSWVVFVKAAGGNLPEMSYLARSVSDRLHLICNSRDAISDLSAKGLFVWRADLPVSVRQSGEVQGAYAIRRINVHGTIRCAVGEDF